MLYLVLIPIVLILLIALYAFWKIHYDFPPDSFPTILAYHKVTNRFEFGITRTTPSQFESQMKFLNDNLEIVNGDVLLRNNDLSNKAILTFDDGYEDFYYNAFPILQKYNFPAIVFLITSSIGKQNLWDANLGGIKFRHLNWEQIREMSENGIEFGSHTVNHTDLTRLSEREIYHELAESKSILESKLGKPLRFISYPFGKYNDTVMDIARNVGYNAGFSLNPHHSNHTFNRFAIKRTAVYMLDNRFIYSIKCRNTHSRLYWTQDLVCRFINKCSNGTIYYLSSKKFISEKLLHLT
jgi:peptidoglycan/xylan/chitin deacetylase (PgdA/CDA1 family)